MKFVKSKLNKLYEWWTSDFWFDACGNDHREIFITLGLAILMDIAALILIIIKLFK